MRGLPGQRITAIVVSATFACLVASCAGADDPDDTSDARADTATTVPEVSLSEDELIELICGPDEFGQSRDLWPLPPLGGWNDGDEEIELAPQVTVLEPDCGAVSVARLRGEDSIRWLRLAFSDGDEGWVQFCEDDCPYQLAVKYAPQSPVDVLDAAEAACGDGIAGLPEVEAAPLATVGEPDLLVEAEALVPQKGDECIHGGDRARSAWSAFVRNVGSAAAPRLVAVVGEDRTETPDLNRGLEPGERTYVGDFSPDAVVKVDPNNAVAEADESNNALELGPLEDPSLVCA